MGEINNAMVCLLGVGTVFVGLIVIVIFCKIMSAIVQRLEQPDAGSENHASTASLAEMPQQPEESFAQQNMKAAVSAALAEMLDTDISNIRIASIKPFPNNPEIPNRQEIVAAVSAAIAEMSGTDLSNIRVLSLKQL